MATSLNSPGRRPGTEGVAAQAAYEAALENPHERAQGETWEDETANRGKSMAILEVPYFRQETIDHCAPACLRMALTYRFPDRPVSEAELARRCRCLEGLGSTPADAFRAAQRSRLPAQWLKNANFEAEVAAAIGAGCPVVANVALRALPYMPPPPPEDPDGEDWHSVLIVGLDDQYVYLHDPDPWYGGPQRAVARQPFFAAWPQHGHSAYRV